MCLQFKVAVETCRLRVLNNDSGQELPTVLHWVAPTEYQPNTVRKCSRLNEGITLSVHVHITCDIHTYTKYTVLCPMNAYYLCVLYTPVSTIINMRYDT